MSTNVLLLLFFIIVLLLIVNLVLSIHTKIRLKKVFAGKKARDLEDYIMAIAQELSDMRDDQANIEMRTQILEQKIRKSIRGVETVRFNPFADSGSNQSFAVALLNEEGEGVVLSSLYSRERVSIFAKPILKHTSTYDLSEEEKEALIKAKNQHQ